MLSIDPLGKICNQRTTKHGNNSGEWLQTEHKFVTGSKAKHERSEPMGRSGSRATVYPVPISDGQVLVDTCGRAQRALWKTFLLLYTCLSCSTNTERANLFYSNYSVSGTGSLYLAMNLQGTIVYNLPYMPLVIDRVIFQLVFSVGVH